MRADWTEADLPAHVRMAPHSVAERWPESALKASAVVRDEAKSAAPVARRFEEGGSRVRRYPAVRSTAVRLTAVRSTAVRSPESAETESAETAGCYPKGALTLPPA